VAVEEVPEARTGRAKGRSRREQRRGASVFMRES
jgi:hypothetical protein